MNIESKLHSGKQFIDSLMFNFEQQPYATQTVVNATVDLIQSNIHQNKDSEQTQAVEFSFNGNRYGLQFHHKTEEEKTGIKSTDQLTVFELGIFQLNGPDILDPLFQPDGDKLQIFEQNQVARMNIYLTYHTEQTSPQVKSASIESGLVVHPHVSTNGWGMGAALSGELLTQTIVSQYIHSNYQLSSFMAYIKDESTLRQEYPTPNPKRTAWSSRLASLLGYTHLDEFTEFEAILGSNWWKYYYIG